MLEGANFILLKGLWDARGVSCRAAEPIGRSLHSLQDARYVNYRDLVSLVGVRCFLWIYCFSTIFFVVASYFYLTCILSLSYLMVTVW